MVKKTLDEWEKIAVRVGIVAGCVIKHDGKYLLVQEKQSNAYKLWNLPAGHVDNGETIEQAAVREVKEETGFDVSIIKKLSVVHEGVSNPVKHAFRARIRGGKLLFPKDELLDARWFSFNEIARLKIEGRLRADWVMDSISDVEKMN